MQGFFQVKNSDSQLCEHFPAGFDVNLTRMLLNWQ